MATQTIQIRASGMMCSFCTMSVESALKKITGVNSVMVNLVHGVVLVEADTALVSQEALAAEVNGLGYPVSTTEEQQHQKNMAFYKMVRWRGSLGMVLSAIDILVDPINIFSLPQNVRTIFSFILAAFVLIWVGKPVLVRTYQALKKKVINANVLLSTAAWGALIVGGLSIFDPQWPNYLPVAAWLMSLHIFSNYFKLGTNLKAAEAVRKLLSLQPTRARVLRGEAEVEVNVEDVTKGEVYLVKPGEKIPLDGEVIDGFASIDESSFTGESVPAAKETGSKVIGGTLNLDGALKVRVTKIGQESFISQLVKLMSQISDRKVPIELLSDKIMNYYGPVVLILGAVSFIGWYLFTADPIQASVVFISTVIMGYPCALGITTPMLAAIAGGKGISIGLLVKSGEVFHQLAHVDTLVFDKTGTLTYGRPTVTETFPLGVSEEELLRLTATVESKSEHPLGRAIGFYAEKNKVTIAELSNFRSKPGQGVEGSVEGSMVKIGNPRFVENEGVNLDEKVKGKIDSLTAGGKTTVVVARDGVVVGLIAMEDTPRRGIKNLFKTLKERKIKTVMLTGDAKPVAESMANTLGIDEVRAQLLPAAKVTAIEDIQSKGKKVAMIGDGINDGPALLQSDVGIAVGAGTDVAIESAGVILIGDKVNDVLGALKLGKASYKTMLSNVAVAVLFNIVGIVLAAFGYITPGLAIGFMIVSIFGILLNTLRIRAVDLERHHDVDQEKLVEIEYYIPKMVCGGCAGKITDGLKTVSGVYDVKPKVAQKRIMLKFEREQISEEEIVKKLDQIGFEAVAV
jgi:P-type Cu+ transporter